MSRTSSISSVRVFITVLVWSMLAGAALQAGQTDAGNALWVGQASGILKVSTLDGAVLLEIPELGAVKAVTVDDRQLAVWVLGNRTLYRFDFRGVRQLALPIPPRGASQAPESGEGSPESSALAADTSDGSVWVGSNDSLFHFGPDGRLLLAMRTTGAILDLATGEIDPGGTVVWIATAGQVAGIDPSTGETRRVIVTDTTASIQSIATNTGAEPYTMWLLEGGRLAKITTSGTRLFQVPLQHLGLVAADGSGGCWVSDGDLVYRIAADGTVRFSRRPFPGGQRIIALITDPSDLSGWAASRSALVQYADDGSEGLRVGLWNGLGITTLGLYADIIPPAITIDAPADGAFLADDRPSIELTISDIGSGIDRGSLALKANGDAFATQCSFDDTGESAICTPDEPFDEGAITLTAEIADLAGNLSGPAQATFTVDLTPPVVGVLTPADGLLTNQPQQAATGSVSEPAELHLNGAPVPLDGNLTFNYGPVTLTEGQNLLAFVATDRAGNQGETDVAVYVADPWSGAVYRVDPQTTDVTTAARLGGPLSVAFGPDGLMYVGGLWPGKVYRIEADGHQTVVAGAGSANPGDGGRAVDAKVGAPYDLVFGEDGSLYFIDLDLKRLRKVTPDGIITTVAGNGQSGHGGDGGPATEAQVGSISGVAPDGDGGVVIAEMSGSLRRIDTLGIISRIAGTTAVPPGTPIDGAPALQGSLMGPRVVRVGPDGAYYVDGWSGGRIRRVGPVSAAVAGDDILVASADAREVFLFDASGRHLKTLNAITGAIVYQFAYDASGLLTTVTDGDGNVTSLQRDGDGNATAIVAPDGQTTALTYDANGYLASVTNPAGETTSFAYTADGLMTSMTDPRGNASTFTYDNLGRLTRDTDAAGGFTALTRTETPSGFEVTTTTATGRTTIYAVTDLPTGDQQRTVTDGGCACNASETVKGADGTITATARDGTVTFRRDGPDPRFGMQAPIPAELTVTTPSGLTSTTTTERQITLTDPNDILSLKKQIEITTVNGRAYRTTYQLGSDRYLWQTAPSGRSITNYLDGQGRIIRRNIPGVNYITYTYDARGRLVTVHQGARTWTLSYDGDGNLASIMDPLSRTTAFTYDAAGRVTVQTLPDGREIHFAYDAAGNVASITPPGRPAHAFSYTPIDQQQSYTPPDVGIGPTTTTYSYTPDRQLAHIARPDGHTVDFAYDASGRLATITFDRGDIAFTYDPTTGQLTGLTAPGGEGLSFAYDGFLQTGSTWTGTVSGSVTRTYDSNFWVTSTSVNGANAAAFAYDNDGMLTQAGDLVIGRDASNGLITGTTLDTLSDAWTYNAYGEPTGYTASDTSGDLYTVAYTRDLLGRITEKAETIAGDQMTWDYAYDAAGRLVSSTLTTPGGSWTTTYTYDPNGNRLQKVGQSGTETGAYDAQDRMLSYGPCTYAYTANGELTTKTCGSEVTSYGYDTFGNLTHVTMPDGITIDYVIDARNRRVGKKVNGTLVQGFLYGDQLNPVAELDGSGNVIARFVYGTKPNVPDYMVKGGITYRYITDQLGSVRLVVEAATGTVAQRIDYDEYGVVIQDTNTGFQPFGFAGGITDTHTGLIRFGARDYDPVTGRWTSKDPIRFDSREMNLFLYASGAPTQFRDPLGLYGTNDCCYYQQRCRESGGDYYCRVAPEWCSWFPRYDDPDPTVDYDFEGWSRCTRKCLQDCDRRNWDRRKTGFHQCGEKSGYPYGSQNPDPATDRFTDRSHFLCHVKCYVMCKLWEAGYYRDRHPSP